MLVTLQSHHQNCNGHSISLINGWNESLFILKLFNPAIVDVRNPRRGTSRLSTNNIYCILINEFLTNKIYKMFMSVKGKLK